MAFDAVELVDGVRLPRGGSYRWRAVRCLCGSLTNFSSDILEALPMTCVQAGLLSMMRGHPTEPEPHHWQAFSRGRSLFPTLLRAS
jgi:hypothetical protein